jgi:hypothetical protein
VNLTAIFVVCGAVALTGPLQEGSSSTENQPSPAGQAGPAQPAESNGLPVSLDRIQKALSRDPAIEIPIEPLDSDNGLPTFRVEIEGQKLTIEEILGPHFLRGPVPYGGMTHQEFLSMVTPKEVQGYAAFSNKEAVTVALTSLALQWALKTALEEFHQARDARAREAARKEVQEALEALRKARREAGVPDR